MRKTSTRIRESRREQRKREDKKSEKSKAKMDNMINKNEGLLAICMFRCSFRENLDFIAKQGLVPEAGAL